METTNNYYYEFDNSETPPSQSMIPLARSGGYANFDGFFVRNKFKCYFDSTQGAVPWQDQQTQQTDTWYLLLLIYYYFILYNFILWLNITSRYVYVLLSKKENIVFRILVLKLLGIIISCILCLTMIIFKIYLIFFTFLTLIFLINKI